MITRALYFEGPRDVAVRDVALPPPAPRELLARALVSAVSQGTELLLYRGEGPTPFDPSLGGATNFPCRYGYAWVGVVVERGSELTSTVEGRRVFALAPHGAAHVLPVDKARFVRDDIPASRVALAANLETALTCVWDASPMLGERAIVLGGGVVGALVGYLLARSGAKVTLVEPKPGRRASAARLIPQAEIVASATPDARADLVVEATGSPSALNDAIAWAGVEARVVVASFYGQRRAPLDLGDAFHRRRLTLVASQVSTIPRAMSSRWSFDRRFAAVEDLLGQPELDLLIAPAVHFESARDLYARLDADDGDGPPCVVFDYEELAQKDSRRPARS